MDFLLERRSDISKHGRFSNTFRLGLTLFGLAAPLAWPAAAALNDMEVSCVVQPGQRLLVSSASVGIVRHVLVDRGAHVRKGQTLMELSTDVEAAQAALSETRAELAKSKLERNKEAIDKHLISDLERDQLVAEAKMANQEADVARRALDQKVTVSPIDGLIVSRKAEPGQYVGADPAFELVSLNPLNVELVFKAEAYGKLKVGDSVGVKLGPPIAGSRRGVVEIVDRVIDAHSGTFGVRVRLANPNMAIPAGASCKMSANVAR